MKKKSKPTQKAKAKPRTKAASSQIKHTLNNQKPPEPEYLSFGHGKPIPTVDSVALVAAALLEKKASSTYEAVCLAIDLMERAAWVLYEIEYEHQSNLLDQDPKVHERRLRMQKYSFSEGARLITRQKRPGRACEYLKRFWASTELDEMARKKKIRRHEMDGFNGVELHDETQAYRQRAKSSGPRKFRTRKKIH